MDDEKTAPPIPGKIYQAMNDAMKKVQVVAKERLNKDQNFKFRGIDDVYNAVHTAFADAGIFCTTHVLRRERTDKLTKSGNIWNNILLEVMFKYFAVDGSYVEVGPIFSEGLDMSDKGTMKALAHAHKYALLQMLMIPTEETKDVDDTPRNAFVADEPQQHPRSEPIRSIDTPVERPRPVNVAPASTVEKKKVSLFLKDRKISVGVFQKWLQAQFGTSEVLIGNLDAIMEVLQDEMTTEGVMMAACVRADQDSARSLAPERYPPGTT